MNTDMTPEEAIDKLDRMQAQVTHGSRVFAEIADVIRNAEEVRKVALLEVAVTLDQLPNHSQLLFAHRVLATNRPDGRFQQSIPECDRAAFTNPHIVNRKS